MDDSLNKLLWRCRRGTKELDILLSQFVREKYRTLTGMERQEFNLLLETQDPLLTEWLCLDSEPPEYFASIVKNIRSMSDQEKI